MTTKFEYAALSAVVYNDQRGGGGNSVVNRLELPPGWQSLSRLGFTTGAYLNTNPFSFTAGAYLNQSTGEIVVAYKGTDFLTKFEGRSWNTVADLVADAALATALRQLNVPAQLYASSFYAAVKDWAVSNGYDDKKISFTGHSLGGGLASNMAVWFDRPAVTFAEGPFAISAQNRAAMVTAIATLTAQAGVTASPATLDAINSLRQLLLSLPAALSGDQGNVFNGRQNAVTNNYNKGEFLEYLRAVLPTVVGTDTPIDIGAQPISRALALHSMNLHAAFLYDDRLRQLAKDIPELVPALIDTKLYASDPNSRTKDLITTLVNDQLRQGFSADSALKRFTTEVSRLNVQDGMAAQGSVRTALLAVAMDYYYNTEPAATNKTIFTTNNNGIHFDYNDMGVQAALLKSPDLLTKATQLYLDSDVKDLLPIGVLKEQSAWHIQSGSSGMIWTGGSDTTRDIALGGAQTDILDGGGGADILIGGAGADFLTGGAGKDILAGGEGADVLNSGTGADTLIGGQGADIYQFQNGDGADRIIDSDGQGSIVLNNKTLGVAQGVGARNTWKDTSGVSYVFNPKESATKGSLSINGGNLSDVITVENFDLAKSQDGTGYLGIKLDKTQRIALEQSGTQPAAPAGQSSNFWSDAQATLSSLAGKTSTLAEGLGKSFTIYLSQAAKAGETLTLALADGVADKFKAVLGDSTVDANGAVLNLVEGQTSVTFALVQEGDVTADLQGALSASYQGTDQSATSNSWGLNITDTGEIGKTYLGDQRAKLYGVEIYPQVTPERSIYNTYAWGPTSWTDDGILTGGIVEADFADVIYAGSGNDKIDGKGGNDALSGGAGNDEIDGGDGNDMIAGGAGNDSIKGGAGDDYISSSANLFVPQRIRPDDAWSPPAGQEVVVSGATWGVYIDEQASGDKVTVWAGIGTTPTDTASTQADSIDGGAGDDWIIASWADDRVQGGAGDDKIDGLAGDDVIEVPESAVPAALVACVKDRIG